MSACKTNTRAHRQQQVANALRQVVDQDDVRLILTTGDNIYAGRRILGVSIGGTGDEDDDWFFTYFQPYRYILNRIPVYPSIGNHDADETEEHDDRAQVEDNFYLRERMLGRRGGGPRVVWSGLVLSLSLRLGHRVRLHRHLEGDLLPRHRLFEYPKHWEFIEQSFPAEGAASLADSVRASSRFTAPGRSITTPAAWSGCCRCSSVPACG